MYTQSSCGGRPKLVTRPGTNLIRCVAKLSLPTRKHQHKLTILSHAKYSHVYISSNFVCTLSQMHLGCCPMLLAAPLIRAPIPCSLSLSLSLCTTAHSGCSPELDHAARSSLGSHFRFPPLPPETLARLSASPPLQQSVVVGETTSTRYSNSSPHNEQSWQ
jgi:hypothetical protein